MHPLLETDASRYSAPGHAFLRLPTRLPQLLEKALVPVNIAGTNDCHVSAGHLVPVTGTGTKASCDRH
jgi:hypothetical protein